MRTVQTFFPSLFFSTKILFQMKKEQSKIKPKSFDITDRARGKYHMLYLLARCCRGHKWLCPRVTTILSQQRARTSIHSIPKIIQLHIYSALFFGGSQPWALWALRVTEGGWGTSTCPPIISSFCSFSFESHPVGGRGQKCCLRSLFHSWNDCLCENKTYQTHTEINLM